MDRDQIKFALSHTIVREMKDKGKIVNRQALLKDIGATKGLALAKAPAARLHGTPPTQGAKPEFHTSLSRKFIDAKLDVKSTTIHSDETRAKTDKPNTVQIKLEMDADGDIWGGEVVKGTAITQDTVDNIDFMEGIPSLDADRRPKKGQAIYVEVVLYPAEEPKA